MKKITLYVGALLTTIFACNNNSTNNANGGDSKTPEPPYTVQVEEFVNPKLPALHSYTHAIYGDKIVMIGGRTNGLHGQPYEFSQKRTNQYIYVIDTKNWGDPLTWTVDSMPDSKIEFKNKEQFRANNAQFFTENNVLYVVGGLLGANKETRLKNPNNVDGGFTFVQGAKSLNAQASSQQPITLPYFTAIDLADLVNAVTKGEKMKPHSIRQVIDSSFIVTGGELNIIDKTVYLVFGWDFSFTGGDLYTHEIRKFTYKDDGKTLTVSKVDVCKTCWDGEQDTSSTGYYRRRDGSLSALIDPSDNSQMMMYYSGVFKNGNTNFDSPVWISKDAAKEEDFVMRSNVYTCQVIPVHSESKKESYATLLGGMTNAIYNGKPTGKPILLDANNAPITPVSTSNPFDHVAFSNQITTLAVNAKHKFAQYLLPDSFPLTKVPYFLPPVINKTDTIRGSVYPAGSPAFNGSESEFIWTLDEKLMHENGVIKYDDFIKKHADGAVVGYLHGGILSTLPNVFGGGSGHYSIASNRLFSIKLVPLKK